MNLLKLFENISPQQRSVGQLPADFKPKKISPVLDGPYGKMNATQGYLVGEDSQGVAEAGKYGSRNPDTMSANDYDRYQQDQMDQGKRDFKRQEHEAEWEQEKAYSAKLAAQAAGPWYIRLNGKLIRDKQGNPYTFNSKGAANKAALTMQSKLFNQGKEFMLTTNPNDKSQGVAEDNLKEFALPGGSDGDSGRWYTDDELADIIGDDWFEDFDVSHDGFNMDAHGEKAKKNLVGYANSWFDDRGYNVNVLGVENNEVDHDLQWYVVGSFHNPNFADKNIDEGSQRVDSLVTDALKIMRGAELNDAVQALKTVLGDREYNDRRGHYNFYVRQLVNMYGQQGMAEEVDTGQYDARKSNAKGATTPDQEKSFREKIKQYSKELEQRQKQKEQGMKEGWKEKLGAAAVTGAMALGSAGANARVTPDGQGGFTGGLKPSATVTAPADNKPAAEAPKGFSKEYLQKAADPNRFGRYMISVEKAQELLKNMQEGVVEGERTMSRAAKGYEKYGKQGMQALAKAGREGKDLDKVRDKYNKYDESVDQGMAEDAGDSPVAGAITRRILMQRTDLLSKYGPEKVTAAIDEVADFVGDVDEIGSSDVSGWVRQVEQMLGNMMEGTVSREDQYVKLFRESVASGMTSEDVLSTLKRKLGDYLQDVATAVNRDNNLVGQLPNDIDQIGPAVKTITTDDGKEIKIHGNEDDGFRISINSTPMKSKFNNIRHAEIATEMYCAHRKSKSKDYVEEA